jgi:hypothetical protein
MRPERRLMGTTARGYGLVAGGHKNEKGRTRGLAATALGTKFFLQDHYLRREEGFGETRFGSD